MCTSTLFLQLSANQEEEEGLRRELAESRELVSSMELQLTDYSEELKQLQSGLVEAEEERDSVLLRLSQLEDECEGLHRTHSRTESELLSTRGVLRDREAFCEEMKDECEAMSDHVTSWASDQRYRVTLLNEAGRFTVMATEQVRYTQVTYT